MTQEFVVENGRQRFTFNGQLLAESSSKRHYKARWIDFTLYRTDSGKYIISRIGRSDVFHGPICEVTQRGDQLDVGQPSLNGVPCEFCVPAFDDGVLFPEKQRTYAAVCETAEGVLNSLYQEDEQSSLYLTRVARELLERASDKDKNLRNAFYEQHIS